MKDINEMKRKKISPVRKDYLDAHLTELIPESDPIRADPSFNNPESDSVEPNTHRISRTGASILKKNSSSRQALTTKSQGVWEGYGIKVKRKSAKRTSGEGRIPEATEFSDSVNILERNRTGTASGGISHPYFFHQNVRPASYGLKKSQSSSKHYQSNREISKAKFDLKFKQLKEQISSQSGLRVFRKEIEEERALEPDPDAPMSGYNIEPAED